MTDQTRRLALGRMLAVAAVPAAWLAGCGGSDDGGDSVAPPPALPTTPALARLKAALASAPLVTSPTLITVTQGHENSAASSFGAAALIYPTLGTPEQSLADIPQVWGHRRELWIHESNGARIEGHDVYPVHRPHRAATLGSAGICGLHFELDGSAFELLMAGRQTAITLIVDGRYMAPQLIETTLDVGIPGVSLAAPNKFVRIDFGSRARRRISVYATSSQGPCALAVAVQDRLSPWDRSGEASFAAMADSYGGGKGVNWRGGPFWEAAALLGIPHLDLDALGSTGYAQIATNGDSFHVGNTFPNRLPSSVDALPDLFLTAGGINDNNSLALPPYATAAAAQAGFNAAVTRHYRDLRAALPGSVLVALGPWAPQQFTPTHPVAQSKADAIKAALIAAGGLWVFLDNLNGGWVNSAGASAPASGPWQTGTGNTGALAGDGNGDLYLSADGVHPNEAGCLYLGTRIASDLRAALTAM